MPAEPHDFLALTQPGSRVPRHNNVRLRMLTFLAFNHLHRKEKKKKTFFFTSLWEKRTCFYQETIMHIGKISQNRKTREYLRKETCERERRGMMMIRSVTALWSVRVVLKCDKSPFLPGKREFQGSRRWPGSRGDG